MPTRPPKPCRHPGCKELVDGGYCSAHKKAQDEKQRAAVQRYDQERGNSAARGYDARWRKYRVGFLRDHPLCAECERLGKLTVATVVDHIVPHRGDKRLFWDPNNHQSMCKTCHDSKTAREDGGMGNQRRM